MSRNSIVFIGFQKVGKTTLGKRIASETGRTFIDTDVEIEKRVNESIRTYQKRIGTKAFRKLEQQVISEYVGQENLLLSTGGGVVEVEGCKDLLLSVGYVYFLYLPLVDLLPRFEKEGVYYQQEDPNGFFQYREKLYNKTCNKKIGAKWDQILLEDNLR